MVWMLGWLLKLGVWVGGKVKGSRGGEDDSGDCNDGWAGMLTDAPRLASSIEIPAPIPRDAPVTTAVFPKSGRLYSCACVGVLDDILESCNVK